jgi:hypothetical protein
MTDEPNTPPTTPPAASLPAAAPAVPPASNAPPADDSGESISNFSPAAQELIRELRSENAKWRTDARRQKEAADKAERDKLAQQGEWKAAYERVTAELEPLKTKADRAEAIEVFMAKTVKARIDALPEQYRALVPKYDDPLKTLEWLDTSAPLLTPPKAPSLDAGARSSGSGSAPLTAEEQAMARRMNLTDAQYQASRDAMLKKQQG